MSDNMKKLDQLEQKIKIKFKNPDLLRTALVHRSYLNEHKSFELDHNERFEFLGDAVLELVVTEYLFKNFDNPEGELTNWRSSLVNYKMLSSRGDDLDLYSCLYLSRGELKDTNLKARGYLVANAYEALIGAMYLDQGLEVAREFISWHLIPEFQSILDQKLYLDPKSRFQEKAQEIVNITPRYKILKEAGPDHNKHFTVGAYIDKELIAKGEGTSKQEAETKAAENALKQKKWI